MALFHRIQLKTSFTTALALVAAAFIASAGLCDAVHAQPAGAQGPGNGAAQGGPPPQPPQEALAVCKTLTSGAACSFTGQRGSVTGTCWAPQGKPLACKPKDAPAEGGRPAGPRS